MLVACTLGSCADKPMAGAKKTVISVLVDNTEETTDRSNQCSKEKLMQTLCGDDGLGYGQIFFRGMNSVALNTSENITFSPRMSGETDMVFDDRKADFVSEMDSVYKKYMQPTKGDTLSRLYKPICEELNKLAAGTANKKILIMLGDGIEYSQDGNFYKATTDALIDEKVAEMEKVGILPDGGKNLKVIFIYHPSSKKLEVLHERAMKVWKKLFNKHHITYEVKPNL